MKLLCRQTSNNGFLFINCSSQIEVQQNPIKIRCSNVELQMKQKKLNCTHEKNDKRTKPIRSINHNLFKFKKMTSISCFSYLNIQLLQWRSVLFIFGKMWKFGRIRTKGPYFLKNRFDQFWPNLQRNQPVAQGLIENLR